MPSGRVTYRQREILLTRFPFSDLIGSKIRPVLVLFLFSEFPIDACWSGPCYTATPRTISFCHWLLLK